MSEPIAVAQELSEVVPGVLHWHLADDRIGGHLSAAHALRSDAGTVLVDPLPLVPERFAELGEVRAILLTSGSHQRSAWRLRRELEVPVWAPAMAHELEEEPDERYSHETIVPGDLVAHFTPGAGTTQHTFFLEGEVAFVPDLLKHPPGEPLAVMPLEYMHDPETARRSLRQLVEEPFDVLCLAHGVPLLEEPQEAIQRLLDDWPEPEPEPEPVDD